MVQIIRERPKSPTFLQKLSSGVGSGLDTADKYIKEYKQNERQSRLSDQVKQLTGMDISGLPPDMQNKAYEMAFGSEMKNRGIQEKRESEMQNFEGALNTVDQMINLRKKGNLGRGSSVFSYFGGDSARDRGEYETLGNSLIQYASKIPIRNKSEFEKLAGKIFDPNITDDEAYGVLEAMKKIISSSLERPSRNQDEKRPPLSAFER